MNTIEKVSLYIGIAASVLTVGVMLFQLFEHIEKRKQKQLNA